MVKSKAKAPTLYGSVPFVLAASDVATAISLGLQRNETPMNMTDYRLPDYVVGHAKKRNIGVDSYASSKPFSSAANSSHAVWISASYKW
ncbi:hypothetical protein GQ600_8248 [Phytophthora cactorum]|nr:hypothetical protein GQ600_8248 [Phytophthora cactorum]